MKTREILATQEAELAPQLKHMKIKELERHAQKILIRCGSCEYDVMMSKIIKEIPTLSAQDSNPFVALQKTVYAHVNSHRENDSAPSAPVIERLTIVLMVLVTKKFLKIHQGEAH